MVASTRGENILRKSLFMAFSARVIGCPLLELAKSFMSWASLVTSGDERQAGVPLLPSYLVIKSRLSRSIVDMLCMGCTSSGAHPGSCATY